MCFVLQTFTYDSKEIKPLPGSKYHIWFGQSLANTIRPQN